MKIKLYVKPGSRRNAVLVSDSGEFKVLLSAPPVDGKANEALINYISELVNVPKSHVVLIKGLTSRHKVIEIPGDEKVITKLLLENASK